MQLLLPSRNDGNIFPSPLEGEGARRAGEGSKERLPRHSVKKQATFTNTVPRNDVHVNHSLTYLPTNLLTSGKTKVAFTLAEVLITLTIIGVVAAMTMPSLIAKHQEKQTVTKLKKTYSVIQQAFLLAYNEHGPVYNWGVEDNTGVLRKLLPYLKVSQNCLDKECPFSPRIYYYLNGNYVSSGKIITTLSGGVVLADGEVIRGGEWNNCTNPGQYCTVIQIQTEPLSKSWILGKNWFQFDVFPDRIIPVGAPDVASVRTSFDTCRSNGATCTAWVIYNENMDYLKCDDLSWTGKTKCK